MGIVGVDFREFGLSSGENRKLNSVTTSMMSAKHKHVLRPVHTRPEWIAIGSRFDRDPADRDPIGIASVHTAL